MKSGVTVTLDKTKQVLEGLDALAENRVLVGIPSEKNQRDEGEITNAALGYLHENGMPELNIPERPFLKPGVKQSRGDWLPYLKDAGAAALSGKPAAVLKNLNAAGITAQNAVRAYLRDSDNFKPLAEATIANRLRRGRTGTKPLLDTLQMLKSVTYVIRKGK